VLLELPDRPVQLELMEQQVLLDPQALMVLRALPVLPVLQALLVQQVPQVPPVQPAQQVVVNKVCVFF
jgi:hypothetical protein